MTNEVLEKRDSFLKQMSFAVAEYGPFVDSKLVYEGDDQAVIKGTYEDGSFILIPLVYFGPSSIMEV